MRKIEADAADLREALTNFTCKTYDDISGVLNWPGHKVASVLWWVRRPECARLMGFTVPHVTRGRSDHYFQVLAFDEDQELAPEDRVQIHLGEASSMSYIATTVSSLVCQMDAHIKQSAHEPQSYRRLLRNTKAALLDATVELRDLEEVSRDAADSLDGALV